MRAETVPVRSRSRATSRACALLALSIFGFGCRDTTPTEPTSSDAGLLILSYSLRSCASSSATVFVDGQAVGRVQIPGALSIPVAVGTHTYSAGASPTVSFEMPPNGRVFFTNAPIACP
ncbi:MAG: hypothetical protein ABIT01_17695 [Thermoanaerobaculia bacterium]